ncbi:hypothetical protein SDC9_139665 [bioreactor metagenome]|uniref:Uncharacterized protein n=1 Tax=bioreactor metagenome TaxID=1076179 RepID=A0A645DSR9_9ZZZZ
MHAAHFTGAQTNLGVAAFAGQQLNRGTGGAGDLSTLTRHHLDTADGRTDRNVANRQSITGLDRRFRAAHDLLTNHHTLVGDDVTALAVGVANQGDVRRTIRIVFQTFNLGRNTVLVALEINETVSLLVTTALMANGDTTIVVAASVLGLGLNQTGKRLTLVQIGIDDLNNATTTWGGRFDFNESHYALPPSTKLIS